MRLSKTPSRRALRTIILLAALSLACAPTVLCESSAPSAGSRSSPIVIAPPPLPPTRQPPQEADYAATAVLAPSATQLRVGETLVVTVTLQNEGAAMIGLPLYTLHIDQPAEQLSLEPAVPAQVEHSLGLDQGESDSAVFLLEAVRPGRVDLWGTISIEVHQGYPGPAFWSSLGTGKTEVMVLAP